MVADHKKRGRPAEGGRKCDCQLGVRINDEEKAMLDYICEKMKLPKSRVIRLLVRLKFDELSRKKAVLNV